MSAAEDPGFIGLGEFFHILRRRYAVIVAALVVCFGLAFLYILFSPSVYTATATVIIDPRERTPIGSDQPPVAQNPDLIRTETQVKLLTSEAVLRRAIDKLDLLDDPDYGKPGLIGRLVTMVFGGSPAAEREKRIQGLVIALGDSATVRRSERTYIFELDVKARSPEKAARLANGIAAAYIEDQIHVNDEYIKRQADWVAERLVDLQVKVQESENRAQEYRADNGIVGSGGVLVNEQQLTESSKLLAAARARTADARGRNDQVRRLLKSGQTVGSLPEALKSTAVEKLRLQATDLRRQEANLRVTYGDRHPALIEVREQVRSVQAQLEAELKRVADGTYNELQAAIANENAVARQVAELKSATTTTNGSLVTLRELEREAEANRAVYERMLRARESLRRDAGDPLLARISSPAVPPLKRTSPRPLAALIAALAGGLAVGMGSALGLEHRDRFRRAAVIPAPVSVAARDLEILPDPPPAVDPVLVTRIRDVVAPAPVPAVVEPQAAPVLEQAQVNIRPAANVDAIAVLPRLSSRPASGGSARFNNPAAFFLEVRQNGQSAFSQAVRDLCATILDDFAHADVVRILVTSLEPGTGKSVLAANLAQAAAEAGERVLLIDANSAHPSVSVLAQASEPPALISLSGTMRLACRLWTGAGSLHLIPLSPAERRLTRRLARDAETEHFDGINANFDLVIVDGPVAGDGEEPVALVAAADDVIVVAGESTTMADVQPLLRRMRAQGKFRGIVRVGQDEEAQVA